MKFPRLKEAKRDMKTKYASSKIQFWKKKKKKSRHNREELVLLLLSCHVFVLLQEYDWDS